MSRTATLEASRKKVPGVSGIVPHARRHWNPTAHTVAPPDTFVSFLAGADQFHHVIGGREDIMSARADALHELHRALIVPATTLYYDQPLVLAKGRGSWLWDEDGNELLDGFGGILTTSLGHCHPRIVRAIIEQSSLLGHVSPLYVNEAHIAAAQSVTSIMPNGLKRVFFTNSGSEAVETAVSLARSHTARTDIIALRGAYHGRTALATAIGGVSKWRSSTSSVPGVVHCRAPEPFRCPFRRPCDESCIDALVRDLEETIESGTNGRPAALIVETIQGVNGVVVPPANYFARVAETIRRFGGLLIADEVQTGLGRTGQHWLGIEHWGVVPDIVVLAKGIAGGLPAAATITRDEIASGGAVRAISTFGGNPISMAATKATLDVMIEEDVRTRAAIRGGQLRAGLNALATAYAWIGEARGIGLMQGLEIVGDNADRSPDPDRAVRLLEAARREGLLLGLGGRAGNVIRFGPNLLISEEEVEVLLERVGRACRRLQGVCEGAEGVTWTEVADR